MKNNLFDKPAERIGKPSQTRAFDRGPMGWAVEFDYDELSTFVSPMPNEQTARLVAVSKQLLELAKEALGTLERVFPDRTKFSDIPHPTVVELRQVIAQAEGGAK